MSLVEEIKSLEQLLEFKHSLVRVTELEQVSLQGNKLPVHGISIGSDDPHAPCLGLFGGVHGLEGVGSQVVISYLHSLFMQLSWDKDLQNILSRSRICAIPIINPGGMQLRNRSNPNGVDLMRNSPVESDGSAHIPLISGHRISKKLPWYRGKINEPMEKEGAAAVQFVKNEMFDSRFALSIDFHSGFGLRDRLWYPYAHTMKPFPHVKEANNIRRLMDKTFPHHIYIIEPQAAAYTISGDLWDHIYLLHAESNRKNNNIFIPWTLEMGSWMWVKKNPVQLLKKGGLFNPYKTHRISRTLRRHLMLVDFFYRAVRNGDAWIERKSEQPALALVEGISKS